MYLSANVIFHTKLEICKKRLNLGIGHTMFREFDVESESVAKYRELHLK